MYEFSWNYKIKNQKDFEDYVNGLLLPNSPLIEVSKNYECLATLIYQNDSGNSVAIELQAPTYKLVQILDGVGVDEPWLDGFEIVDGMYDDETEIFSGINDYDRETITFDNAKELMLTLAKELCR